jgi:hypothetical protein
LNSRPVYNIVGGSAVVALIVGARKNPRGRRLPWYLLALAQTFFVTGDVLAYNYETIFGGPLASIRLARLRVSLRTRTSRSRPAIKSGYTAR